ncbi:zinc-dependent alcohol dehydrogenase [Streptomyces radiopugnans]|uniref:zinc-dependent alcohol dehydrogenase n=1 Tax=Streptomyces radiopugnans TaxID=403935 RepID=UPI003F1B537C
MGERTASGTAVRTLGVREPGKPAFFTEPHPERADGRFRVETLFTGLSAGTELAALKGTDPFTHRSWNRELRLFEDRRPTARARYPMPCMGYMEVGRVTGSGPDGPPPGATVAMAYGHRTAYLADPARDHVVPLPEDLDPLLGVFVAQMGPICANGLLHAAAEAVGPQVRGLGDGVAGRYVLVTGGGVVGLLTALFALHHGAAAVAVADPTPQRLAAARALGCEAVSSEAWDPALWCKQRWRHSGGERGADVVFQCRGRPQELHTALRALRPQGTVVDLAFYQDRATAVHLGEEFHHNGLAIRCAQISRVPRGCAGAWDRARLSVETLALLRARGREVREHLVTDIVPFDRAPDFLCDLAARRRHSIQAVFAL